MADHTTQEDTIPHATRSADRLNPPTPHAQTPSQPPAGKPAQASSSFLSNDQILQATEAVFAEAGYDGTTIRAIAKRLGCSVGSIYRYFEDKRDLLRACAARVFSPVARYLDADAVRFDESLRMYLQLVEQYPQLYRLMFWLGSVDDAREAKTPEPITRMIDGWTRLVGHRATAEHIWAMAHGSIMLSMRPDQIEQRILAMAQVNTQPAQASAQPATPPAAEPSPTIEITDQAKAYFDRDDVTLL